MGLKYFIYRHLPLGIKSIVFKKMMMDRVCGYGEPFRVTLDKAFRTYLTEDEQKNGELVKRLTNDIVECWLKYMALPYEYFLFNFKERNDAERWEFETDMDRIATLCRVSDENLFGKEIRDKYNFYLMAKPYFKREAIKLDGALQEDEFIEFIRKHGNVFVKPLNASKGKGVRVFTFDGEEHAEEYYRCLLKEESAWMVEELIKQSPEMGCWNMTSVNTIRIPTFLNKGKFTVIWTRMRTGKKGAIVDNLGSGGIVVSVDPQTGVVTSDGVDDSQNYYERHPDSGLVFKGWQVPKWKELVRIVEDLHRNIFNKHVYVAWDFALTNDGWAVVEGNWGQLLGQQSATQVGLRRQFHELVGDDVQ